MQFIDSVPTTADVVNDSDTLSRCVACHERALVVNDGAMVCSSCGTVQMGSERFVDEDSSAFSARFTDPYQAGSRVAFVPRDSALSRHQQQSRDFKPTPRLQYAATGARLIMDICATLHLHDTVSGLAGRWWHTLNQRVDHNTNDPTLRDLSAKLYDERLVKKWARESPVSPVSSSPSETKQAIIVPTVQGRGIFDDSDDDDEEPMVELEPLEIEEEEPLPKKRKIVSAAQLPQPKSQLEQALSKYRFKMYSAPLTTAALTYLSAIQDKECRLTLDDMCTVHVIAPVTRQRLAGWVQSMYQELCSELWVNHWHLVISWIYAFTGPRYLDAPPAVQALALRKLDALRTDHTQANPILARSIVDCNRFVRAERLARVIAAALCYLAGEDGRQLYKPIKSVSRPSKWFRKMQRESNEMLTWTLAHIMQVCEVRSNSLTKKVQQLRALTRQQEATAMATLSRARHVLQNQNQNGSV